MQINKGTLANLYKGFKAVFMAEYQAAADEVAGLIAMTTQSSAAEEVYHWLGALPGMKKLIDEIKIENVKAHNYTIANDEWEDTVEVKQADIERDRAGIYRPMFASMGEISRQHDGEQVAALLCSGFVNKCYTGKNFFDTGHEPIPGGKKFSNKGVKKLSQANYRTARTNLRGRLNAAGRAMKLGKDFILIVSSTNESLAREILKAERSDKGQTNVDKDTARLIVWPEIDAINPDMWFLIEAGKAIKPLIIQEERAVQLLALDNPESDHVFKNHTFLYQAYKRAGYGYGLPELAYGSTGENAA